MASLRRLPGLRFESVRERTPKSPLRSDVAGFAGGAHRGPVDQLVRVESWRDYQRLFGGLDHAETMAYSIKGYFENGGQVAHVHRIPGQHMACSQGEWHLIASQDEAESKQCLPVLTGKPSQYESQFAEKLLLLKVRLIASSPGPWADGLLVKIAFLQQQEELRFDFVVHPRADEPERFTVLIAESKQQGPPGKELKQQVENKSRYLRVETADGDLRPLEQVFTWQHVPKAITRFSWEVTLRYMPSGSQSIPVLPQYVEARRRILEEPEVALLAFPDFLQKVGQQKPGALKQECPPLEDLAQQEDLAENYADFLSETVQLAAKTQDRLVLADGLMWNEGPSSQQITKDWTELWDDRLPDPILRRTAALYAPLLKVNDPHSVAGELLTVSTTGHVAGAMARVDRERGAHHTPANVPLLDAVDVQDLAFEPPDRINRIRSIPGKGLMIWGGRTLDEDPDGKFVSQRRFIHRLIRAIRRAAEPLVFDLNRPELWRMLARAVTTVLLEAFRGGALVGETPKEAFFVKCDDKLNPLSQRETGFVACEIGLALAAPMEFITLRVAVSREGELEVFES